MNKGFVFGDNIIIYLLTRRIIIIGKNLIVDKSFDFALDVIKLYRYLTNCKKEYIIYKQFLRSGTSIGANVKEGINGFSKADFRYKMSIALKEANETEYWIKLLIKSEIISEKESVFLLERCRELCRIVKNA